MSGFDAMTVNERFVEAGLLEAWDLALERRDRNEMIAVLGQVDLAEQAASIVDQVLKNKTD